MTPEDRITLARITTTYHLPDTHFYNNSDILNYFNTHSEYKKAKKIYWNYMMPVNGANDDIERLCSSPLRKNLEEKIQFKPEEFSLWYNFQLLMMKEFTLKEPHER